MTHLTETSDPDSTTWRLELAQQMQDESDPGPVEHVSDEGALDVRFVADYGGSAAPDITVWTALRVYYVHEYDGLQTLYSVPRNPPKE